MRRAGRRTVLEVRRHRVRVMRRNVWRYLLLAVVFGLGAALSMASSPGWLSADDWRGFLAGAYVTAFVAFVAYSLTLDGSHLRRMGDGGRALDLRRTGQGVGLVVHRRGHWCT